MAEIARGGAGGEGGGAGGKGGRGKRGPLSRDVMVSKKMSWLLRHGAEKEGLTLDEGGFVSVDEMLNTRTLRSLKVTFPELRQLVADNDKKRYTLLPKPNTASTTTDENSSASSKPSDYLIRANQGHSLQVESSSLLQPITQATAPSQCVHGTTRKAWPLIVSAGGLKVMGRNHVHFATGLPASLQRESQAEGTSSATEAAAAAAAAPPPVVISGMRNSSAVLVWVDLPRAMEAGVSFWTSDNGVVLSEGEAGTGLVPLRFFKRVEERGVEGGVLVEDGVVVGELKGGKGR
ncbi:hypothetical protein MBLNU230_g0207t1 [Neophaeotheca triangularis]